MKYCRSCNHENSAAATVCASCGAPFGSKPVAQAEEIKRLMRQLPILSLQSPQGWEYTPVSMVTAQTVSGTGLFAEVSSLVTDMFGRQSGAFADKLRNGEELCKASLRAEAIKLRANAILAVDVDYEEVGGSRSMLMVCMTGTAVRLRNLDVLEPRTAEAMNRCTELFAELDAATAELEANKGSEADVLHRLGVTKDREEYRFFQYRFDTAEGDCLRRRQPMD
jgi:uncharacterized protein YbjQ (UPF0145 family)